MSHGVVVCAAAVVTVAACVASQWFFKRRERKRIGAMSVADLLKLYGRPAGDDVAGPELERRGACARDELIAILDAVPLKRPQLPPRAERIVHILSIRFPSEESLRAVERLRARVQDPLWKQGLLMTIATMRGELRVPRAEQPRGWPGVLESDELMLESVTAEERIELLPNTTWDAFRVGDRVKAEVYARELLAMPDLAEKSGDGVYWAHQVMGMLALERDDVEAAKRHLLESARTPGSTMLNADGPSTELAEGLFLKGERDVVVELLQLCKRFWKYDDGLITRWTDVIRRGKRPYFRHDRLPKRS